MNCLTLGRIDDLTRIFTLDCLVGFKTKKLDMAQVNYKIQNQFKENMRDFLLTLDVKKFSILLENFAQKEDLLLFLVFQKQNIYKCIWNFILNFCILFQKSLSKVELCSRYTNDDGKGVTVKAKVDISRNTIISDVLGIYKNMEPYEEKIFVVNKTDFSVLYSARKKCSMLMVGPIACINHDCSPNCEYSTISKKVISLKTMTDIKKGEELFVSYGSKYFELKTISCECQTCILKQKILEIGKYTNLHETIYFLKRNKIVYLNF